MTLCKASECMSEAKNGCLGLCWFHWVAGWGNRIGTFEIQPFKRTWRIRYVEAAQ